MPRSKSPAAGSPVAEVPAGFRSPMEKWGGKKRKPKKMTKALSIKKHCLECNGQSFMRKDEDCINEECFLYQHRPWKIDTEEE